VAKYCGLADWLGQHDVDCLLLVQLGSWALFDSSVLSFESRTPSPPVCTTYLQHLHQMHSVSFALTCGWRGVRLGLAGVMPQPVSAFALQSTLRLPKLILIFPGLVTVPAPSKGKVSAFNRGYPQRRKTLWLQVQILRLVSRSANERVRLEGRRRARVDQSILTCRCVT
jgi:hypothetical protein